MATVTGSGDAKAEVGEVSLVDPGASRFAGLVGAAGTAFSSALLVPGFPGVGYAVAAAIALAAGLAATTGLCLGCRMYRSVLLLRRLDVI